MNKYMIVTNLILLQKFSTQQLSPRHGLKCSILVGNIMIKILRRPLSIDKTEASISPTRWCCVIHT